MQVVIRGSTAYDAEQSKYYSALQGSLQPCCWIFPESPEDVAHVLRVLQNLHVAFAIKSGGHAILPGASNIEDGITIDLSKVSHVTVPSVCETCTADDLVVRIGTGARWEKVYNALVPKGLAVAGGRLGDVGVGGYLLGGGLSYFSNRLGWACDAVLSYDIVLANGTIVTASSEHNQELFWALKGGSNQFGIVTQFTLQAWKQPEVLIGAVSYNENQTRDVLVGLQDFNEKADEDLYASALFCYMVMQRKKLESFTSFLAANGNSNTSSSAFRTLDSVPASYDGRIIQHPLSLAIDVQEPRGYNQWEATLTLYNRVDIMLAIVDILKKKTNSVKHQLDEGAFIALTFQPLTRSHLAHTDNAFGIDPGAGPLICHFLQVQWPKSGKSEFYQQLARSIFDEIETIVQNMGANHPFRYINYAADFQDVFASYGEEKLARLRRIRDEVDPNHVFKKNMPGGFKL